MSAPKPASSIREEIKEDLLKAFKDILIKYLDDRTFNENKVKRWINNILEDAKNYFINKYPNYDLFLQCNIYEKNVYFRGHNYSISVVDTDLCDNVSFGGENLYSVLYFLAFKSYNLSYSLNEYEDEIIRKGNDILMKYLEDRKFDYDKCTNYNYNIDDEHCNFILEKEKYSRCHFISEIFQNPIKGKFFYNYFCHGKNIYSKIIQTYSNDSLTCYHYVFFFK